MAPLISNLPAPEGARRVALGLLDEAQAATGRLLNPSDTEALHDFRVAIRRLRSVLRAYASQIEDTVAPKWQRRLRDIARRTNAGRDGEVQHSWLHQQLEAAGVHEPPPEVQALDAMLRSQTQDAYAQIRSRVLETFQNLDRGLRPRLLRMRQNVWLDGRPASAASFGEVTASLLREHVQSLWQRVSRIGTVDDEEEIHDARIEAKRLRYILEPLRAEHPEVKGLLKWLKKLQDELGDLNDMRMMLTHLRDNLAHLAVEDDGGGAKPLASVAELAPNLAFVEERAAQARLARYQDFSVLWRGGSADQFLADSMRFASQLASGPGAPVMRAFLLSGFPNAARKYEGEEVRCGWLLGEGVREAFCRRKGTGGVTYHREVSLEGAGVRHEVREGIDASLFERLWRLTQGTRVRKRVYRVEGKEFPTWFVEQYADQGLVLARTYGVPNGKVPDAPRWLSQRVVREVTEDAAFSEPRLAAREASS